MGEVIYGPEDSDLDSGPALMRVIADNPAYPPFVVSDPDGPDFQPVARVRAVLSLL